MSSFTQVVSYFSPLSALRRLSFGRDTLREDLLAGITVSLVAIPQSLAYAQLAGVPAYYGLYAALIPTIVGAVFGSSRQLSTGPVAMTSLLTAASVAPLAARASEQFYSYVILLALVSGLFQILFGMMRMGALLNFLSHPVLMGFINAAALIIGLSQFPALLGVPVKQTDHFMVDIVGVLSNALQMHEISFAFGIAAFLMLIGFRKYAPKWPGILITVAVLTWVSYVVGYAQMGGRVVGTIPQGLPHFGLPAFEWHTLIQLAPAGFIIAIISFMEAMSSSKVIAIKTKADWDQNQELVGQGLAKVAAAFSNAMPVSGSFSRSALNLASNARTGLSSIISAVCVLLALLFLTPLLHHLPKPVLASIIMMAVIGLINFKNFSKAWRANRDDGIASIVTFIATLAFAPNIQNGIMVGVLLSIALLLYRMMRPHVAISGSNLKNSEAIILASQQVSLHPNLCLMRFDGALRFVNVSYFEDALLRLAQEHPHAQFILVKCNGINSIDASGIEMLTTLVNRFRENGIILYFSGFKPHVLKVLEKTGLLDIIGKERIFMTGRTAVDHLNQVLESGNALRPAPL